MTSAVIAAARRLADEVLFPDALASGCLATAFVWIQHRGLVTSLAAPGDRVGTG